VRITPRRYYYNLRSRELAQSMASANGEADLTTQLARLNGADPRRGRWERSCAPWLQSGHGARPVNFTVRRPAAKPGTD